MYIKDVYQRCISKMYIKDVYQIDSIFFDEIKVFTYLCKIKK